MAGIDSRKWCVRAIRPDVTYPVSLHRYRWGARRHCRRIVEKEARRAARTRALGYQPDPVVYQVDRASAADRAALDGWVASGN